MTGENPAWDTASYEEHGRFVSDLGGAIAGWLAPQPGEIILDAGCGDGALTARLAESGAMLEGVEMAPGMVAGALARGLSVRQMDLLDLDEENRYDAIFSNAVLHWIEDWPLLLDHFSRALKRPGRLVVECGGAGNIERIRHAIAVVGKRYGLALKAGPESYKSIDEASALLASAGFEVKRIELVPRPTPLKSGMAGWLSVFREPFFRQIDSPDQRQHIEDEILSFLKPDLYSEESGWFADYVCLRFEAVVA